MQPERTRGVRVAYFTHHIGTFTGSFRVTSVENLMVYMRLLVRSRSPKSQEKQIFASKNGKLTLLEKKNGGSLIGDLKNRNILYVQGAP
jgi:hypothetical protein